MTWHACWRADDTCWSWGFRPCKTSCATCATRWVGHTHLMVAPVHATDIQQLIPTQVGLSDPDIARLLTKFPRILEYRSEKTISKHIDFFLNAGVDKSDIPKVVMRAPMVLELSIPNTLQPRLDFLTEHAHVPVSSLGKLIGRHPLVLTCTEEGMRGRVDFLTNEVGMPPEDVARAVLAHPQVGGYQHVVLHEQNTIFVATDSTVNSGAAILGVCHARACGVHAQRWHVC